MSHTDTGASGLRYEIFTDGACLGNPGPGAFAWVRRLMVRGQEVSRHAGCDAEALTTNNRMEMLAAFDALDALGFTPIPITIYSDSQNLVRGMTEWLHGWKERGWRKPDKKPVLNADLWSALDVTAASRNITWTWVKGHSGNPLNEVADGMASEAAAIMKDSGRRPTDERRRFQIITAPTEADALVHACGQA
jgi:ribonuclease HI